MDAAVRTDAESLAYENRSLRDQLARWEDHAGRLRSALGRLAQAQATVNMLTDLVLGADEGCAPAIGLNATGALGHAAAEEIQSAMALLSREPATA